MEKCSSDFVNKLCTEYSPGVIIMTVIIMTVYKDLLQQYTEGWITELLTKHIILKYNTINPINTTKYNCTSH